MDKKIFLEKIQVLKKQGKKTKLSDEEIKYAIDSLDVKDLKLRFFIGDLIVFQGAKSLPKLLEEIRNPKPEIRRSTIYLLGEIAKKKKKPIIINSFCKGLLDEDPKVRRNSGIILGNLSIREGVKKIITAIKKEKVNWVRPSLILALGAIGGKTAKNFLSTYQAKTEDEQEALRKALDRLLPKKSNRKFLKTLSEPVEIELWTFKGLETVLMDEAKQLGLKTKKKKNGILSTITKDLYKIFSLRTFSELLIPIGVIKVLNPQEYPTKIEQLLQEKDSLRKIISLHKDNSSPLYYRVEVRGKEIRHSLRRQMIKEIIKIINTCSSSFTNSPSNYDIEIRVIIEDDILELLWKPFTIPDHRFAYRLKDTPASINPVVAAGMARLPKPRFNFPPEILDPFCGSATILIERALKEKCKKLIGVDISKEAIEAAKANVAASGLKNITLINDDMRHISRQKKFDEIITNMPFGLRVGSHAANLKLYQDFFCLIPKILKQNGLITLYTQEINLTTHLFRNFKSSLKLLNIHRLEVGGLRPAVFIGQKI